MQKTQIMHNNCKTAEKNRRIQIKQKMQKMQKNAKMIPSKMQISKKNTRRVLGKGPNKKCHKKWKKPHNFLDPFPYILKMIKLKNMK